MNTKKKPEATAGVEMVESDHETRLNKSQSLSPETTLSGMGELNELTGMLETMSRKLVHLAFLVASLSEENDDPRSSHSSGVDPLTLAHSEPFSKVLN